LTCLDQPQMAFRAVRWTDGPWIFDLSLDIRL
jgi:hypothetical protein